MQPYQYKPLPSSSSIRILILHPAADISSALECDIITKDRLAFLRDPDNKTFDAVSYVWGHGAHNIPLYCTSEGTYLYISAVVDEMLRNLRKGHKERRLWVDALCLNQKDNEEKSVQVQQKGQIYHMADKVHIWLGPAVATTPLAFAFLRTVVAKFEPTPDQAREPTTEDILHTFEETFHHRNVQPVLGLLQNPWFTRRWTLQEGFLARNAIVRFGDSKLSWNWFTEGLKLIQKGSHQLQHIQNDKNALYALNVLKALMEPSDLLSLLWTLHMSQCSDPRDRIYSLLGLAQNMDLTAPDARNTHNKLHADSNSKQELPKPDYALTVDVVYRKFAGQCISTHRFLQILLHIDAFGRLSDVDPKWPSWVPNWTGTREGKRNSPAKTSATVPNTRYIDRAYFVPWKHRSDSPNKIYRDGFVCPQPTMYSHGNHYGLVIYGRSVQKTIQIHDTWPGSHDSDYLVKHLADWIHQEAILHLSDRELDVHVMSRVVIERVLFLMTGCEFFGYEKHISFRKGLQRNDMWCRASRTIDEKLDQSYSPYSPWLSKCRRVANMLYPIAQKPSLYTPEQIQMKQHLDRNYYSNPQPTPEDREELSDLLYDVSRMMREGRKRLIVASCDEDSSKCKRQHWIAPSDVRIGDVITDMTHCGRVGALLRPIDCPSSLNVQSAFQLIGILWSLHDYEDDRIEYTRSEEFLIL